MNEPCVECYLRGKECKISLVRRIRACCGGCQAYWWTSYTATTADLGLPPNWEQRTWWCCGCKDVRLTAVTETLHAQCMETGKRTPPIVKARLP